jgi:hypothetical protein
MIKYTTQIAALATMALSTPWANAQVDVYKDGFGAGNVASGTGPLVVDGDAQVSGTLTVQPENVVNSTSNNNPTGAGIDPSLGSVGTTTTTVVTKLGETEKQETATTGGGAIIESNGDASFTATTGTESDATFSRFTTVDVYNSDQPDAGQPVPGSQMYYAADSDGSAISPMFTSETDLQNWIDSTPLTDPAFDGLVNTEPTANSGGNVDVGGNLSLADTGSGGVTDAAAAINENASDIDAEETARIAADDTLQSNIDAEESARIAGDDTLQSNIDAEESARIAADTNLQSNIDAEETARIAADNTLQANIDTEVATRSDLIRRESDGIHLGDDSFIFDDQSFNHRLTTNSGDYLVLGGGANATNVAVDGDLDVMGDANFQQDVMVGGDLFINGNEGVQSQLNDLDRRVDENARGIAMVAALQHTTVLPGMTNALDVAAAHFEGETGFSINFARRLNENWQVNFGAASTTDLEESVVKAGVGVQW